MSFYGKIYEQANNIFNRLKFKNAAPIESTENIFQVEANNGDIELNADGGQSGIIIEAGNPWITFKEDDTVRYGDSKLGCKIYHNSPRASLIADSNSSFYGASCVIERNDRDPDISDYEKLIADGSPLTPTEKQELIDLNTEDSPNKLLYFGDTFTTWSPIRDIAGHIVHFKQDTWQIGPLPRILDILSAENRIGTLEDVVGPEGYENEKTITTRVTDLETGFEEVERQANQAESDARTATSKADEAAGSAKKAEEIATNLQGNITTIEETLGEQSRSTAGIIGALGTTNSSGVSESLEKNTFLEWAEDVEDRIGAGGTNMTTIENLSNGEQSLADWALRLQRVIGNSYNDYDPTKQTNSLTDQIRTINDVIGDVKSNPLPDLTITESFDKVENRINEAYKILGWSSQEHWAEKPFTLKGLGEDLAPIVQSIGISSETDIQEEIGASSLLEWAKSINNSMTITLNNDSESGDSTAGGSNENGDSSAQVQSLTSLVSNLWFRMAKVEKVLKKYYPEEFQE